MKLKINIWTGIMDIINCILFAFSWFAIFASAIGDAFSKSHTTSGTASFFYFFAAVGLILNIISLVKNRKYHISMVGPILGIIGNGLFVLGAIMAFPAIVLLIIASVFTFMQKSVAQPTYQNQGINNNQNYQSMRDNSNGMNYSNNQKPMTRMERRRR
ncbi:MerC domain-containing protein [Companilactobacillus crustorum]|uniref:MerC domain-containing protein n=1 Tax=Companilactobacillus crustorum TaxID=392416 RepID=UPI000957AEB5|nr:hypothetical protein BI355_2057 [Companilactobacillus crustorum]